MQEDGNKAAKFKVVSLDSKCATHAVGQHNEIVMKAFKMACLQYKPSPVNFEHETYKRQELVAAKDKLLKYCLSQLKHLDLSASPVNMVATGLPYLDDAWNSLHTNQDAEGVNYAEVDPRQEPAWHMKS